MIILLFGSIGLIVYTFVGYPAIVGLLARLHPKPIKIDRSCEPVVSLIIAAYNEAEIIESRLENAHELEYPSDRLEIIVVADGSDDETAARARKFPRTTVLHQPERQGKLAAMNRAAKAARGEILVFSDANNAYSRGTLRELVAPFADPSVGMVTGRKAIDDGAGRALDRTEGLYWRYESKIKEWESAIGSVTGVAGEILAFRRDAFYSPPPGTMNEDFVQAMLAATNGWRVVYAPGAVSLERASATIGDEAVRRSRLVTGRWQALWQLAPALARHPQLFWQVLSHKGFRPLVPFAILTTAVSSLALAPARKSVAPLVALQAGFYIAALVGWRNERKGRRNRWAYVPYYFLRMNGATLDGFRDFVSRRHEAVWAKVRRG